MTDSSTVQNLDSSAKLGGVTYSIAGKPDYQAAHRFLASEGIPRTILGFPTVIARLDGEIIGLISTDTSRHMIVAGPMVVRSDRPRYFTILRLIDAYENVLRMAGVQSYIFHTDNSRLYAYARDLGLEPYAQSGDHFFFVRRIGNGPSKH